MILASILILTQVRASENVFKKIYEVGNEWDEGFGGGIHAPVEWGTNLMSGWLHFFCIQVV